MKKFLKIAACLALVFAITSIVSCGKSANTPVDQIVKILDDATKKTEAIKNANDIANVKEIVSPQEIWTIIRENSDYKLTDNDKEKLKKSYDKLVKVAFDKCIEFLPGEEYKEAFKSQCELMTTAVNQHIDAAETLGEINGLN